MAFDGITVSAVVRELNEKLAGGRIDKVYQPEKDEIQFLIRAKGENHRLLLTCSATNPRIHLTQNAKPNPIEAPQFTMVLRKHLQGGRVISFEQLDFDRIIHMNVESMSEMGDLTIKRLVVEIMGKHSNIILVNDGNTKLTSAECSHEKLNWVVVDSLKHISRLVSSVRQILPGYAYMPAPTQNKLNPNHVAKGQFMLEMENAKTTVHKAIYMAYTGISPGTSEELTQRAGLESTKQAAELTEHESEILFTVFENLIEESHKNHIGFITLDEMGKPAAFSVYKPFSVRTNKLVEYHGVSAMLEAFYQDRDTVSRIQQKSHDLKRLVQLNIDRCIKKRELQQNTLDEIANREYYKLCGELLTSNIYAIKKGMAEFTTMNFFDENQPTITIELDQYKSPSENAQAYFKKYNKQKRTFESLQEHIKQNDIELEYFDSVLTSLNSSKDENDINDIRDELTEQGILKKKATLKGEKPKKSMPLKFTSSDGFEIYVGKNNKQNDELTFRFAMPADIWLHAKNIPGSHVILRLNGKIPTDIAITEAAKIAAYYSKSRNGTNVAVDYTERKNVKKPSGAKPGFVIYDPYKTAFVMPDGGQD